MRRKTRKKYRPWIKALSGLSINVSAAWFAVPFIGTTIKFPQTFFDVVILTLDIILGILFLLITVLFERKLEDE